MLTARTTHRHLDPDDFAIAPCSPEQELFIAVIETALLDYAGQAPGGAAMKGLAQRYAEAWFFSPLHEADFTKVCAFANVDPDFVRDLAQRVKVHGIVRKQGPSAHHVTGHRARRAVACSLS